MSADDFGSFRFVLEEKINFRHRSVETGHLTEQRSTTLTCACTNATETIAYGEVVIIHVQNQILAHHSQADQTDISSNRFGIMLKVIELVGLLLFLVVRHFPMVLVTERVTYLKFINSESAHQA